jgi:iron uptake system component EfeO
VLVAVVSVIALASGCSASKPAAANVIAINSAVCGALPHDPRAGMQVFQIANHSTSAAEVDLVNPANGAIYAEVAALGPETIRPMRVDIGSGVYAFRCLIADTDPITGPEFRIAGHVSGAPAILPVTNDDLIQPATEYHSYVSAGLVVLAAQTRLLNSEVQRGDLAAARAAWLPAHLTYERLGAAYGTFGTFDDEIDGRPDGLIGGVDSPDFTGFYRLEYGLWHGQPAAGLRGPASKLYHDVEALQAAFPAMEIDLLDIGLRTHEILENALEFQLTGHDDFGSGTTLATTAANITGTLELLSILHPLLADRYAQLPAVYAWLAQLQRLIDAQHRNGEWTPVSRLSMTSREQIDAAASQALQELAPIAVITEPRRV